MISRHRRQQNPAPAQQASLPHPPPRRRRKPQNPWVMPWILQREERGCHRTLLDELITTDIPGYRNFTRIERAFFYLIEERIPPPSQEINHQLQEATGSWLETGSYIETRIHRGNIHFTVNHQLQEATGSWLETGSYIETLIHRGNIHFTAIPMEGWKNDHLQICPPGLQSHFERISTRIFDVSH